MSSLHDYIRSLNELGGNLANIQQRLTNCNNALVGPRPVPTRDRQPSAPIMEQSSIADQMIHLCTQYDEVVSGMRVQIEFLEEAVMNNAKGKSTGAIYEPSSLVERAY